MCTTRALRRERLILVHTFTRSTMPIEAVHVGTMLVQRLSYDSLAIHLYEDLVMLAPILHQLLECSFDRLLQRHNGCDK